MKFRPVHEICLEELTRKDGKRIYVDKAIHWAELYAKGAIAPVKAIPKLIAAIKSAANGCFENGEDRPVFKEAIKNLEEQLKAKKETAATST